MHRAHRNIPSTGSSCGVQVHAEGKSLDRSGDAEYETDALLSRTAAITIGYSGAELENLLNEAAILTVSLRPVSCPWRCPNRHAACVSTRLKAAKGLRCG